MASLNRILVLKDLGLSLDQFQGMLNDNISTDDMQNMLLLKKAEIEQELIEKVKLIRKIQACIQFIRDREEGKPINVVMKEIPRQSVMKHSQVLNSRIIDGT